MGGKGCADAAGSAHLGLCRNTGMPPDTASAEYPLPWTPCVGSVLWYNLLTWQHSHNLHTLHAAARWCWRLVLRPCDLHHLSQDMAVPAICTFCCAFCPQVADADLLKPWQLSRIYTLLSAVNLVITYFVLCLSACRLPTLTCLSRGSCPASATRPARRRWATGRRTPWRDSTSSRRR